MESYHSDLNEGQASQEEHSDQTRAAGKPQEARSGAGLAEKLWTKAGLKREVTAGLLAAVCALGVRAVQKIFEEEVTERVGVKGKHSSERDAVRHGYDNGEVTLGGRRVQLQRPRMRAADGSGEIPLATYQWATGRDVLNQMAYQRVLAGVSTRNYPLTLEPISARSAHRPRSISKSAISRRFIALARIAYTELMSANLSGLKPVVLLIDGASFAGRMCVVAMVIDVSGNKHPVGLIEGATENKRVVTDLLADLVARGLDSSHGLLVGIDGAKALAAAVREVFGKHVLIQRCIEHKLRNVEGYLHKDECSWVRLKLRLAWKRTDPEAALRDLKAIASRLEETNIDAAKSLREGLHETLTIQRLGVGQVLARTLRSTNAIESMWEIVRAKHRNVKHWKEGDMRLRWAAAGMLEAQSQFKRVEGCRELPALARALYHATVLKQEKAA